MDVREVIDGIEEAVDRINEAMEEIRMLGREVLDERAQHLLERGALSYITMALSNDHGYLGGNMHTVEDTLNELRCLSKARCECGGKYETVDRNQIACMECGDDGGRMVDPDER